MDFDNEINNFILCLIKKWLLQTASRGAENATSKHYLMTVESEDIVFETMNAQWPITKCHYQNNIVC